MMSRFNRFSAIALSVSLGACVSPPVEAPQSNVEQQTDVSTSQNKKDMVDLLFMIDDSASMSPKQNELKTRFPDFIKQLDAFGAAGNNANYHIGVVTSSMGAPGYPSSTCLNLGGKLQKKGLAVSNTPGCSGPTNAPYLIYDQVNGHTDDNVPSGQDAASTFSCMASVVDPINDASIPQPHTGCGFEAQLEAVYQALHNTTDNAGFLRDGAILAVVWITDEDDCSMDPTSTLTTDPNFGPVNSYRCAQKGIWCDGGLLADAPQSYNSCAPATVAQNNGLETDIQKYINYFKNSSTNGGVKGDPRDVILAAITGPNTPVAGTQVTGGANCGSQTPGGPTFPGPCTNIAHSCTLDSVANYSADPSQRLTAVINGVSPSNSVTSICDNSFAAALNTIATKIVSALSPSCLSSPLKTITPPGGGTPRPDCVVQDVTIDGAGNLSRKIYGFCGDSASTTDTCWDTQVNSQCKALCDPLTGTYVQTGVFVNRHGGMAPAGTTADISCNTIAIANQGADQACADKGNFPPTTDGGTSSTDM